MEICTSLCILLSRPIESLEVTNFNQSVSVQGCRLTPSLTRFVIQAVMKTLAKSPRITLCISSRGSFEYAPIAAMTRRGRAVAMRGTVHAGTVFF